MIIGDGCLTSKTKSHDEREFELKKLKLIIYNTELSTLKIHARYTKINVYCLYSENNIINFFNGDLHDKKIPLLNYYEEKRNELEDNQYILYDLTIDKKRQLLTIWKRKRIFISL